MGKPHKHAEILRAIADGKEIEWKSPISNTWEDCGNSVFSLLQTATSCEFRIKPQREYPKTSLTDEELRAWNHRDPNCAHELNSRDEGLRCVANAAIRRYIDDQENKE